MSLEDRFYYAYSTPGMFLPANTPHKSNKYQLVYCHMVCLAMVHSQCTAEQHYLLVKTYLHNNNIYQLFVDLIYLNCDVHVIFIKEQPTM